MQPQQMQATLSALASLLGFALANPSDEEKSLRKKIEQHLAAITISQQQQQQQSYYSY